MVNREFILKETQKQLESAIFRFNKWQSKKTNHFHIYQNEINMVMINFLKKELKIFSSYELRSMNTNNVFVKLNTSNNMCSGITFSEHKNAYGTGTKDNRYNDGVLGILIQAESRINYNAKILVPEPVQLSNDLVVIKNLNLPLTLEDEVAQIFNNVKNYKI